MTSDAAARDFEPARATLRLPVLVAAAVVFGVLVTANSAGYRYGISDQSFYIPAFEHRADPSLFPRDGEMIDAQSKLTVADELVGGFTRSTGLSLPPIFLAGYLLTILVLVAATWGIGSRLYASSWSAVALGLALTLRHRIAKTGVNTFEGYFHPRVLTFAIGLLAVAALMHSRRGLAIALVGLGIVVHPTTGVWFAVWVGVAMVVATPVRWPVVAAGVGTALVAGAAFVLVGPLRTALTVMDPEWAAVLGERDYLYPTDWAVGTWLVNAIAPVIVLSIYFWRRSLGLVTAAERGVVTGAIALLVAFVASLPFIAERIALAVQLQTSRVLWQVEVLALAYLVWAVCEAPWRLSLTPRRRQLVLVTVMLVVSVSRGAYILRVEHDNALVSAGLPETPWLRAARWIGANTPADAHVLADPDHAWRYGVSFRIAGRRDIFLELAKDAAIAMYSRPLAMQITERRRALGNFNALTPALLATLDERYDLDYVITEQHLPLPVARSEGPLHIYRLDTRP